MFGNQNANKKVNDEQALIAKVNSDLLVRNMPSSARLSGANLLPAAPAMKTSENVLTVMAPKKNNHQIIGILIIAGGVILIGALVYLSYIYIIKPQVSPNTTPAENKTIIPPVVNTPVATTSEETLVATTSTITTVTPTVDFATSSASTTFAEEGNASSSLNLPPLVDSDSDGLNDEEEAVLGTNLNLTDSNNNTYNDLVEINNNYNPVGTGKLSDDANLATYSNKIFGYSILYSKAWANSVLSNDAIVIFTAPDDSIIQISVQDNSDRQSLTDWFSSSFPDQILTPDKVKLTPTWEGAMGNDNLNFYLTDKNKKNIYIISYIPALTDRIVYPNIYKLMINSFLLK
jgi:hypothetical protein